MFYVVQFKGKALEQDRFRIRSFCVERESLAVACMVLFRHLTDSAIDSDFVKADLSGLLLSGELEVTYVAY